jgi:hypothetical protein
MHIRRGDFLQYYPEEVITVDAIWKGTKHLLDPQISTLLYIATDETNLTYFEPFRSMFELRFLDDYSLAARLGEEHLGQNQLGMVEQVICANAHTFIGTPLSTFTGYITRMRGTSQSVHHNCSSQLLSPLSLQLLIAS